MSPAPGRARPGSRGGPRRRSGAGPRARSLVAAALASILPTGCRWGAGTNANHPAPLAARPASGLARRIGEPLELTVPLLGGGARSLHALRGRAVLLELSDAAGAGRDADQARYRALVDRSADALTVVSVALDPDVSTLPAAWLDAPPPFVLGWDPQGALAARLQLVVLPTVALLDPSGTIVAVYEGRGPDDAALERWLGLR